MHRRTLIAKLTTGLGLLAGFSLIPKAKAATVEIDADIRALADSIPNVDQSPLSHREAINHLLVGLGSTERAVPPFPEDTRIPIPEFNPDDPSDFYNAVRRALIVGGIGKDPD